MQLKRKTNVEFEARPDLEVTNPEIFTKKTETVEENDTIEDRNIFSDDGLFSKRIFGDLNSENEYTCKCGKFYGKFYDGVYCNKCGTEVVNVTPSIERSGWINLRGNYIVKYIPYQILEKMFGKENILNIIRHPNVLDINGNICQDYIREIRGNIAERRYWYVGLAYFREHYNEILDYYFILKHKIGGPEKLEEYLDANPKEKELYYFMYDPDEIFTDKISVMSTVLRPGVMTANGFRLDSINIIYVNILKNAAILKNTTDRIDLLLNSTLEEIQAWYFQLGVKILTSIKSKPGLIRNQMCGARLNNSARNIISPARAGIKIDELEVPYLTFMNLYKFEIINTLKQLKNITNNKAMEIWESASTHFNKDMHTLMTKIIEEEDIGVIFNRNPTIAIGSTYYMKIASVKANYDDMTTNPNNTILTPLNGDYDGDVLNIISIKDRATKELFKKVFSPTSMLIDCNTGEFNKKLSIEKDQLLGMNSLMM